MAWNSILLSGPLIIGFITLGQVILYSIEIISSQAHQQPAQAQPKGCKVGGAPPILFFLFQAQRW